VAAQPESISATGNGPKRRGPKTLKGKARVAFNAVKHGISAKIAVIPGLEQARDWETVRNETLRDLAPQGFLEIRLAEEVASCLWRRRRVVAFETASITAEQVEVEGELDLWHPELPGDDGSGIVPSLWQLEDRIQQHEEVHRLLGRLWQMPNDEPLEMEDAVAILQTVAEAADVDWQAVTVPGVPTGVALKKFDKWTVKPVRAAIMILGEKAARTPQGLIKSARRLERRSWASDQILCEQVKRAVARRRGHLQQRHLLPDAQILERIQRHEAHLMRQMAHALHELEAAQKRRRGESAPLARIDVQGLAPAD
jgi:hypothetical protein